MKRMHQPWYPGETLPFAIGQGYLTVTPLQMARLMGVVATQGVLVTPHLYLSSDTPGVFPPENNQRKTPLENANFSSLREGLWAVVNEPHGTGHPVRMKEMEIAGKTGTAQVISNRIPEGGTVHEKFVRILVRRLCSFAHPRIVVAVLVENGGDGGDVAGPVARAVFQEFYRDYLAPVADASSNGHIHRKEPHT